MDRFVRGLKFNLVRSKKRFYPRSIPETLAALGRSLQSGALESRVQITGGGGQIWLTDLLTTQFLLLDLNKTDRVNFFTFFGWAFRVGTVWYLKGQLGEGIWSVVECAAVTGIWSVVECAAVTGIWGHGCVWHYTLCWIWTHVVVV